MNAQEKKRKRKITIIVIVVAMIILIVGLAAFERMIKTDDSINLGNGITVFDYKVEPEEIDGRSGGTAINTIKWVKISATFKNDSNNIVGPHEAVVYFNLYKKENIFSGEEFLDVCKVSNRRSIEPGGIMMAVDTEECTEIAEPGDILIIRQKK